MVYGHLLYLEIPWNGYCTLFESIVGEFNLSLFILEKIDFDYFEKMIDNLLRGPAKIFLNTSKNILNILHQDFLRMLPQALRDPSSIFWPVSKA